MSAILSLCHEDEIELVTDGAVYRPDGVLTAIQPKAWASKFLPMAVAGRGNSVTVAAIATDVLRFAGDSTFDALIDRVVCYIERLKGLAAKLPGQFEVLLAGIATGKAPRQFIFTSHDLVPGFPAFTLNEAPRDFFAGPPVALPEALTREVQPGFLAKHGGDIMDAMRRQTMVDPINPGQGEIHGVGGFCQLLTVKRSGCEFRTLRVWPDDTVGQRINPFGGAT